MTCPPPTPFCRLDQIAAAIRQMHSQRIMHRDLKPANVFVSKNAVVKVGDVGLGRIFSSQTQAARSMCGYASRIVSGVPVVYRWYDVLMYWR